ncbi:MAG: hypothetical protein ACKO1U_08385 [Bacteroidota bacterium]
MPRYLVFLFLIAAIFQGCYYDSVEELYPISFSGNCDTTGSTYSSDIGPVFSSYNCSSCHSGSSPSGGIDLSSSATIRSFIQQSSPNNYNRMMGAIRHKSAYPMPNPGTKIDNCSANRIEAWILKGCPD